MLALPFLLGTCLSSLRRPLFLSHAPAPIHSFSPRCVSRPPYDLVLWTDSSFPFDNRSSGVLANCSLCGTEATLSLSAGPVYSSFSAEACAIKQALCWSWQHQQVCHFSFLLLSDSRSVLIIMFSPPSFLLPQSFWQELSSFSSCSIRLQWVPGHFFCRETAQLMSWPDRERYSCPLQFLVVFFSYLLYPLIIFL